MPIQVQLPDGSIGEFPDGMADADIERALQSQFGSPKAKPDFSNVQSRVSQTVQSRQASKPVGKFLGNYGGRQVLQGVGGLVDMLGGAAFSRFVEKPLGLSNGESYRDKFAAVADRAGMRKPTTPSERIISDVGEALTGTGVTMGIGSALGPANRLGDLLTSQPKLQTISTATGAASGAYAREQGASPGVQFLAGLLGGLAPGAASASGGATLRGLVRGRSGQDMRNTLADFNALGADASVGQASGNRAIQGIENLLSGGPTSAGVMNRFAERQAENIGSGLQKRGNALSPNASAERAGRAVERGADQFKANTGATKRALYWQADQLIPSGTQVPLANTWQEVVRLTTPNPGAAATTGAMVSPKIANLRQTLEQDLAAGNGAVTYEALKRIRSDIGEAITDFSLSPDSSTRELKAIYGALSRDMEAAAQSQGPSAVAAAQRANNYTRAAADRLETLSRVVDKNGGPEKVYSAVMSGTQDGGTVLRSVMQSLPRDGQKALTAAVIKRMGLATPGAQDATGALFSAQTFIKNWNTISPEAKRALFDRYGPGFTKQMDQVARVADNIKQGSKVYANPSGTTNRAAALTYGASLVASLFDPSLMSTGGLVASGAGANWLARALTNPNVVKRLAEATMLPTGSVPAFINSLNVQAAKSDDPDLEELARQLSDAVEKSNSSSNKQKQN